MSMKKLKPNSDRRTELNVTATERSVQFSSPTCIQWPEPNGTELNPTSSEHAQNCELQQTERSVEPNAGRRTELNV